jgi:diguanylate cyclase
MNETGLLPENNEFAQRMNAIQSELSTLEATLRNAFSDPQNGLRHESIIDSLRSIANLHRELSDVSTYVRHVSVLARTDAVTQIPNRRAFDERLDRLATEPIRRPMTLVLVDIDGFKQLNDRFGHAIGDRALRCVASALKNSCPESELVARFGGEEFAVLFQGKAEPVSARMDHCRQAMATSPSLDLPSELSLTISCGVAERKPEESIGHWMRRVDEALYCAKQNGRNCVVWRDDDDFRCHETTIAFLGLHPDRASDRSFRNEAELHLLKRLDHLLPSDNPPTQ